MKSPLLRLTVSLAACCALVSAAQADSSSSEKALKLSQTHYFFGTCELIVARDAVRLENTARLKFVVVAKAPDWTVTVFRNDDKTYFSESLAQFADTGLISNFMVGQRERMLNPALYRRSNFMFCGLKAVRMTNRFVTMKYLPLDVAFNAAPQVEMIVYAMNKMPTCGGIPLTYIGISGGKKFFDSVASGGAREIFLETSKVVAVDVSPNIFTMPAGYKRAKSVREVVAGAQSRLQSEDYMETLGREGQSHK